MNEEIHDRFYDDIDGEKHFNSTQLVERYHCEGNGALCDMDCETCEFYKKYYKEEEEGGRMNHTKEPWRIRVFFEGIIHIWTGEKAVAEVHFPYGKEADKESNANAQRIVACVNACAGITNEALEKGLIGCAVENLAENLPFADGNFYFDDVKVWEDV